MLQLWVFREKKIAMRIKNRLRNPATMPRVIQRAAKRWEEEKRRKKRAEWYLGSITNYFLRSACSAAIIAAKKQSAPPHWEYLFSSYHFRCQIRICHKKICMISEIIVIFKYSYQVARVSFCKK